MTLYFETELGKLYHGHVLEVLRELPSEAVHCVITSPPYWGLRDYGIPPQIWDGDSECEHDWRIVGLNKELSFRTGEKVENAFCRKCGAWLGSLGLEPTPDLYVAHIVQIFREIRRVLRKDGTVWLNLGDSYMGAVPKTKETYNQEINRSTTWEGKDHIATLKTKLHNLKPKDLCGIPWRVALALQTDGWWLRQDIIWVKAISFCPTYSGSVMPESVKDRFCNSYEHIFLLAKNIRYFFDLDAVREKLQESTIQRYQRNWDGDTQRGYVSGPQNHVDKWISNPKKTQRSIALGRAPRSVWAINPQPFPEAHFATFPMKLPEIAMKVGCPQWICKKCGKARERIAKTEYDVLRKSRIQDQPKQKMRKDNFGFTKGAVARSKHYTLGWTDCRCRAGWEPGIVLDPFMGAGTTAVVAERLGRKWIGIELSEPYCSMTKERIKRETQQLELFRE